MNSGWVLESEEAMGLESTLKWELGMAWASRSG
jgi:hypothetical protein